MRQPGTRTRARRARQGLVALLACAASGSVLAAPASAETDPPQLTNLTLDPSVVNTSAADQTVTIEISATDAGSGIHHVIARLTEPGGVQFDTSFFGQPSTGNKHNGMWRIEVTLPRYSPQGTYELSVEIVDDDGNALTLSPAQLQGLGVPNLVNQVAPGDLTAPGLTGVSFSPAAVDTSGQDRIVDITVSGLDDLSGIELINSKLTGPGGTEIFGGASGPPDTGSPTNGSWVVSMVVPQGSPPGTYTLSLDLTDGVGRLTSLSAAQIATLGFPNSLANNDTTSPGLAIVSGPNGLTNQAAPTFGFTSEAGSALQCSVDQGTPSFGACSAASSHTPAAPLADGQWTFRVKATDLAANVANATRSFAVDTVAPDTVLDTGPTGLLETETAEFAFSSPDGGASFECRLDGGAFEACGSPRSYADLTDGGHSFDVRAVDAAGNADQSPATRSFSVDATPPAIVITSGPEGPTSDPMPVFEFAAEAGSSVECSFDQGNANFGPCSTGSSATPAAELGEGDWTFRVRATDGGKRSATATRSFAVDLQLPDTVIESGPAAVTWKTTAKFKFSGDGATRFECKFRGTKGRGKAGWTVCESPTKYRKLEKGKYKFKVRGIDAAGNIDATPAKSNFKVLALR